MSGKAFRQGGRVRVSLLTLAIAVSVGVHAFLLWGVKFGFPDPKALRDKAMEVILVNAKSAQAPRDAQVLAQANMDGGGTVEEERRAQTPLPSTPQKNPGRDAEQLRKRIHELEARQQHLMTQMKSKRATASAPTPAEAPPNPTPPTVSGADLADAARAMARLEGEIAKQLDEYAKRPRRSNAGARAKEYIFAQYLEEWRQKIERVGTLNYPAEARGKLYGRLTLTVSIRPDGSVDSIEINSPSGYKVLDDAALRIVRLASPFAAFPPAMRRDTDILEITRTWYFTQGDALSAK